ncbi:MAG: peptide MFS transporter [Proteobacteria bacterium]|nr:peptide MFS transporter [Pseudomonadota bacterium]
MSKGHPKGLYTLFFTEMWERLAFYLMLGILVLYGTDTERGGLGLSVVEAAEVYGTYMAFVYFTPFLGGMIADRYIGYRRAVAIGGVLMASGLFCLGVRSMPTFYGGLTLMCLGNGLFKPNISAMVGNLYEANDTRRDAGFNIFYMGINIGAAVSALISAPLRNMWSFNYAFIAAGIGLVIGVIILFFNWKKLAVADKRSEPSPDDISFKTIILVILVPAGVFGAVGYFIGSSVDAITSTIGPITFGFIIGMLPILAYFGMLVKKSTPEEKPGMSALIPVYIAGGTFFMILHLSGGLMTFFAEQNTDREADWMPESVHFYSQNAMPSYYTNASSDVLRPSEDMLALVDKDLEYKFGARRLNQEDLESIKEKYSNIEAMEKDSEGYKPSWGSLTSKVFENGVVKVEQAKDPHGNTVNTVKTEPQTASPLREVVLVRTKDSNVFPVVPVSQKTFDSVYQEASKKRLKPGKFLGLVNAEMITSLFNPVFVVLLTPIVVAFFAWRIRKKKAVTTARKIFYGMIITTISLFIIAMGAYVGGDGASKISAMWLIVYYGIITFGELCLSPMGLSLITKLSPKRLVGLMMGGWFLSTSIGNKLAGFISGLEPTTTIFIVLGSLVLLVAGFIFVLLPRLDSAIKKYGA